MGKGTPIEYRYPAGTFNHEKKEINELQTITRGQMEAEISKALISFEKEHMGRGSVEARTYILRTL